MSGRHLEDVLASIRGVLRGYAPLAERVEAATGLPLSVSGWDVGEVVPPLVMVLASRASYSRGSVDTAVVQVEATLPVFGSAGEAVCLGVVRDVLAALYGCTERVLTVDLVGMGPEEDGNWVVSLEATVQF